MAAPERWRRCGQKQDDGEDDEMPSEFMGAVPPRGGRLLAELLTSRPLALERGGRRAATRLGSGIQYQRRMVTTTTLESCTRNDVAAS